MNLNPTIIIYFKTDSGRSGLLEIAGAIWLIIQCGQIFQITGRVISGEPSSRTAIKALCRSVLWWITAFDSLIVRV